MEKDVELAVDYLRNGQKELDGRVRTLEVKAAATDEKFITAFRMLDKIDKNTTWLVRLVMGTLIVGLLAMLIRAGGG